jgi:hypothetical protein
MTATAARQHLEWLRFAEPTGPFLSLPVLLRAFPQGVEKLPGERAEDLFERLAEWREATQSGRSDFAVHRQWCLYVLRAQLRWPDDCLPEAGSGTRLPTALAPLGRETLAPSLALINPAGHPLGASVRVLVDLHPPGQSLDKPVPDRPWRASPVDRMVELLRGTGVRLGLVTNGAEWRLVQLAAGEMPGVARWDVDLWLDERGTLDAFVTMLEAGRFFTAAATDTPEALFDESAEHQHEVTVQLGDQVRRAVEVLVQALDRADRDAGGELLHAVAPIDLYDAALTVMMRLVFLFAAEERGLIGAGSPLYQENLAVSTLLERLEEAGDRHGEEVLETRHDAWSRLLATFRAIHGGAAHEDLSLPAYGGSLFDPDRYPFLEGRVAGTHWRVTPARPLPVSNRTVLHLLRALQMLEVKTPGAGGEKRRLSFQSLDIENIGHVYEGLLDHTALRAEAPNAPVLGLAGKNEPEIPLPQLESERARGQARLIEYLREETGRSEKALESAIAARVVRDEARARRVCGNDASLYERVRPWLGLVRDDTLADPVIVREGSVYVTSGAARRTSGTYYTPRTLTEPIVRHALDPVVHEGPAEGWPEAQWRLRPARELLALKVCDFAMGSGAFLVQACRYLADRLVEAWDAAERSGPTGVRITPEGERSGGDPGERLIPLDPEERRTVAMRLVADRCLYGVDRNPMAVDMAKLSLWLVTLQKDRPFNFLDHALRCGDSLLGVTRLEQLEGFSLVPGAWTQIPTVAELLRPALAEAVAKRHELESFPVLDITDAERKAALLAEADGRLAELKTIGDLLLGCALAGQVRGANPEALLGGARDRVAGALDAQRGTAERRERFAALAANARHMLDAGKPTAQAPRRPFHWALEFPEVYERGGFDAMVANPPFLGGKKISGPLGRDYREHLVLHIAEGTKGHADLSAYFVLRVSQLLRDGGTLGMIATNTIAQGDTREVGLELLLGKGFVSPRAIASQKWPGEANLEMAVLWLRRGSWGGAYVLDGVAVSGITPFLTVPGAVEGKPYRLAANAERSFIGSYVLGLGFVLTPEEAEALIAKDQRNRDVLFPYLNGEDLNSRWDQSPSRWVISFRDWPLDHESARAGYRGPLAADYADCLRIVEEKVRPERTRTKPDGSFVLRRPLPERWWQFADKRPDLYATIAVMESVLAIPLVSKYLQVSPQPVTLVFSHALGVVALDGRNALALLQSTIHDLWARKSGSTLESRMRYTPSDCFETFPFPVSIDALDSIGERYNTHRRSIMAARREGFTDTYNRFHSPDERSPDIGALRELHVEMDRAVAAAYGWADLDLGHSFHATKQGVRFTVGDRARREILTRLLVLNHERYKDEVAQGLHEKRRHSAKRTRKRADTASPSKQREPTLDLGDCLS